MLRMSKILVGLGIASIVVFANPTSELGEQSISKADSEFLFKDSVTSNVITLNSDEMKATEGELAPFPIWYYVSVYAVSYANAPAPKGRIYTGRPYRAPLGKRR